MQRLLSFLSRYLFGIFSCLYLFTLGLRRMRNRDLIHVITRHFGYGVLKALLPIVPLSALAATESCLEVRQPYAEDGNVSTYELVTIISLIKAADPQRMFEIGTYDGRTTLNMAANSSPAAEVYTLDLPKAEGKDAQLRLEESDRKYIEKEISGATYRGTQQESKITQVYGDTATYDFSPFFGTVDLVFVDASHSYEYVLNDSRVSLKMLRGGKGIILWHDYDAWDGVTKALNELRASTPEFRELKHIQGTSLAYLKCGG